MADKIVVVCPTQESLKTIENGIPCSQRGCDRIFPNQPTLKMHLIKTHGVVTCAKDKETFTKGKHEPKIEKHFYCPVKHCTRGIDSKRPFPRLGQLKQHYMSVHAEKKHKCSKCNRGFGMPDACRRHENKCGQMFPCSCGCPFTTREAMLTHARRKNHAIPPGDKTNVTQNSSRSCAKRNLTNASRCSSIPYLVSVSQVVAVPPSNESGQLKENSQQLEFQSQNQTEEQQRIRTTKQPDEGNHQRQLKYRNILPKPTGNLFLCQTSDGKKTLMKIEQIGVQSPNTLLLKQNENKNSKTPAQISVQTVYTQTASCEQTLIQSSINAETQTTDTVHEKQYQPMVGKQMHSQVQWIPAQRQTYTQTQLPMSVETQTQFLSSTQMQAGSSQVLPNIMQHDTNLCEIQTQTPQPQLPMSVETQTQFQTSTQTQAGSSQVLPNIGQHDTILHEIQTQTPDLAETSLKELESNSPYTHRYQQDTTVNMDTNDSLVALHTSVENVSSDDSRDLVDSAHKNSNKALRTEEFSKLNTVPLNIHTQTPVSSLDFDFSDMRFSGGAIASVEDNETQTLISSLDLDLADSGTQTHSFLEEMFSSASFSNTETQTWLSNWHDADSGTENQIFEDLVHMETQTSLSFPLLSEIEDDITLTDTHTQTFQDDFDESVLMSANVQTQTSVMTQDFDVINNMLLNSTCTQTLLSGSDGNAFESNDVQTQTLAFPNDPEKSFFDDDVPPSNTESGTNWKNVQ